MPGEEDPKPKESEAHDEPGKPTELSIEEFHERADYYLGELVQRLEEAQENDPAIEVDYSVSHDHAAEPRLDTNSVAGWRARSHFPREHIRTEQTTPEQADLAQFPNLRTEAIRLGRRTRRHGLQGGWWHRRLGIHEGRQLAH